MSNNTLLIPLRKTEILMFAGFADRDSSCKVLLLEAQGPNDEEIDAILQRGFGQIKDGVGIGVGERKEPVVVMISEADIDYLVSVRKNYKDFTQELLRKLPQSSHSAELPAWRMRRLSDKEMSDEVADGGGTRKVSEGPSNDGVQDGEGGPPSTGPADDAPDSV